MQILGHGIDIVETDRIDRMIEDHGDRFLERVFTAGERAYCDKGRDRVLHYAGRFAAKEAVLKALGTGWAEGIAWTDVEVVRLPSGPPQVELTGRALEIAQDRGISQWYLSISHIATHATASAIAEGS
jgi:holo-[acyl-carrier protein] synthase